MSKQFQSDLYTCDQQYVGWGQTKFKPTNYASSDRKKFSKSKDIHTFRKAGNKTNHIYSKFFKEKKDCKFDGLSKETKPDYYQQIKSANEIVYKNQKGQQFPSGNVSNSEAETMKQRQINYRKSIIEQKAEEDTVWEDFCEQAERKNKTLYNAFARETCSSDIENKTGSYLNKKLHKHQKMIFKKNASTSNLQTGRKKLISEKLLKNFDSKKLNYKQNDKLRRTITNTTIMAFGQSLEGAVKDIRRKLQKKKDFSNK